MGNAEWSAGQSVAWEGGMVRGLVGGDAQLPIGSDTPQSESDAPDSAPGVIHSSSTIVPYMADKPITWQPAGAAAASAVARALQSCPPL